LLVLFRSGFFCLSCGQLTLRLVRRGSFFRLFAPYSVSRWRLFAPCSVSRCQFWYGFDVRQAIRLASNRLITECAGNFSGSLATHLLGLMPTFVWKFAPNVQRRHWWQDDTELQSGRWTIPFSLRNSWISSGLKVQQRSQLQLLGGNRNARNPLARVWLLTSLNLTALRECRDTCYRRQ